MTPCKKRRRRILVKSVFRTNGNGQISGLKQHDKPSANSAVINEVIRN